MLRNRTANIIAWALLIGFFAGGNAAVAAEEEYTASERDHWSFKPRSENPPPKFDDEADRAWIRNDIDAFVLSKLKQKDMRPAAEADRRVLVRRLYFDFTGLPPTPAAVESFVQDEAPDAYEKLVEELLASPRYGERWGQHWLDVVRFAESEGFEYDNLMVGAWRFRDYVIDAFNQDKPFNRFLLEQLAGDELNPADQTLLIAAGFNRLGPIRRNAGNQEVAGSRNEELTEMTNAAGAVFMGLTIGCARCHDHIFDPIRQRDYYQLQAFFAGTREHNLSLASETEQAAWQLQTIGIKAEIKLLENELEHSTAATRPAIEVKLKAAYKKMPPVLPALCTVRFNENKRTPIRILERGNWDHPGDAVGMRAPGILLPENSSALPAETTQARRKLAEWLIEPNHPLTARVIVNRIWLWHFGNGIVNTPNDFGANGDEPSHPELLDYLANRFVAEGWSIKALHRLIALSSTYRQASFHADREKYRAVDPENRLLWQFNRQRLDAEAIRDAMLAVSGRLNLKAGGESVIVPVDSDLVDLLYKPSQWEVTPDIAEHDRRSIYLIAKRNLRLPFMEVFDQPDLQSTCARRHASTHAPQALEMLNGQLSNRLAESFAERLTAEAGTNVDRQIELAFELAAGRAPTSQEKQLSARFLAEQSLREFALAMFNLNAFLYVD